MRILHMGEIRDDLPFAVADNLVRSGLAIVIPEGQTAPPAPRVRGAPPTPAQEPRVRGQERPAAAPPRPMPPDDWRDLPAADMRELAFRLTGVEVRNKAAAIHAIEAYVARP